MSLKCLFGQPLRQSLGMVQSLSPRVRIVVVPIELNERAAMKGRDGSIRTSIQRQSGGQGANVGLCATKPNYPGLLVANAAAQAFTSLWLRPFLASTSAIASMVMR